MNKFERLERLVGTSMVNSFKNEKILIVGCGGVGGYVIEGLVRSCFTDITVVDYDMVDITNCNRQIIALNSTISKDKVDLIKERALDINSNINITCYKIKLDSDNIDEVFSSNYTYVIDACDDIKAKELLITYCLNKKIQIITCL